MGIGIDVGLTPSEGSTCRKLCDHRQDEHHRARLEGHRGSPLILGNTHQNIPHHADNDSATGNLHAVLAESHRECGHHNRHREPRLKTKPLDAPLLKIGPGRRRGKEQGNRGEKRDSTIKAAGGAHATPHAIQHSVATARHHNRKEHT